MKKKKHKPVAFKGTQAQIEWRMCYRKTWYKTKAEAERNHPGKVYHCPVCGKFHRTSTAK